MKPPCDKDCERRSAECATSCKEWAEYVAERNENYAKRRLCPDMAGYVALGIARRKKKEFRHRRK